MFGISLLVRILYHTHRGYHFQVPPHEEESFIEKLQKTENLEDLSEMDFNKVISLLEMEINLNEEIKRHGI